MIEEPTSSDIKTGPVCPWCSHPLLGDDAEHCPSCGAAMTAEQEPVIPGVTTIEPEILARQSRAAKPKRGGIMSLFVGREDEPPNIEQPTEAELPALARPSVEVRREMLRIELEGAGVLPPDDAAVLSPDDAASVSEAEGDAAATPDDAALPEPEPVGPEAQPPA